jgi:uncharacterized membrane protein YeiB
MTLRPYAVDGRRIVGLDVARGLAVLGMFGAHIGVTTAWEWGDPGTWLDVVNGRSSILFAALAGVSIAIISGRDRPLAGTELHAAQIRIVVRAGAIFLLGALLELLGTNVAVILPYYALLFLIALPVLRLRAWLLFALAGVMAILAPVLVMLVNLGAGQIALGGAAAFLIELLFTGYYPVLVWTAFLFAGLGIGRLDLRSLRVQLVLLGSGIALAVLGYGLVPVLEPRVRGAWAMLVTSEPHSGSPFEVVGSGGVAVGVIGLCLLLTGPLRWVLYPVAAVGSMALTVYSLQIVAIAALDPVLSRDDTNWPWLWFTVAALAASTVWALTMGKGPFEQFLTRLSTRAALPTLERGRANTDEGVR